MTPIEWAKRPLELYADFSGRATRPEYWWYVLAVCVANFVAGFLEGMVGLNGLIFGVSGPLTMLLTLGLTVPGLAVTTRRLHDTNRSGYWLLVAVVPYLILYLVGALVGTGAMASGTLLSLLSIPAMIGGFVMLVLMVLPGTVGANKYGPDPTGAEAEKALA